jgi:D-alanyl-D-alanine carboxypeptidase
VKTALLFFTGWIFVFALAYFYQASDATNAQKVIASPLPSDSPPPSELGVQTEFWIPNLTQAESREHLPKITAESAISYDLTDGKLIFAKNIKSKLPMASLTKIMTATIALQNMKPDTKLKVSQNAAQIGENSMGLTESEKLALSDLLYGLLLASGNDAAETIAEESTYGRDLFVYMMNKKAEELGLTATRFTNPSGLEGDGSQYSTAYDLLVMTKYALENPIFAKIVSTYEHHIPYSQDHKEFYLYNETNLLTSYPGVKGVKTGYTYEAGLCLVTYLEYGGHKIIAILLNAENRRQEMKDLLDYSLKTLKINPPPHR